MKRLSPALCLIAACSLPRLASASEAELVLPDLSSVQFLGSMDGSTLLLIGLVVCLAGMGFGLFMFMKTKEPPRAQLHGGHLPPDLRDLQDLPHHPGQVPGHPVGLHRGHHGGL